MSRITLKALVPGETTAILHEFQDCAAGAPLVWQALQKKYLFRRKWVSAVAHLKGIWSLPVLPRHHRAVLAMTADGAMVMKADYPKATADIRAWLKDFPSEKGHWQEIAAIFASAPACPAIGFHLSDTRNDPWSPRHVAWENAWDIYAILSKHYPRDTLCGR